MCVVTRGSHVLPGLPASVAAHGAHRVEGCRPASSNAAQAAGPSCREELNELHISCRIRGVRCAGRVRYKQRMVYLSTRGEHKR